MENKLNNLLKWAQSKRSYIIIHNPRKTDARQAAVQALDMVIRQIKKEMRDKCEK